MVPGIDQNKDTVFIILVFRLLNFTFRCNGAGFFLMVVDGIHISVDILRSNGICAWLWVL